MSRIYCLLACLALILSGAVATVEAQMPVGRGSPSLVGRGSPSLVGRGSPTEPPGSEALPSSPLDSPVLGNVPDALSFTYSIPDQRLLPAARLVTPLNVGDDAPLTWTVTTLGSWFAVAPLTGVTPASFWITPTVFGTGLTAFYTGVVTVTVVEPVGTEGSPHRIDLNLQVVETPLNRVYFPLVLRNYALSRYPDDPSYGKQWALEKIGAPAAWGYSTGRDVLIAVLDTGTDLDHPDLADKVRTDIDRDFINSDYEADDDFGHGTHVSGIAAAATDNGVGVAGLGWEAMLLPLKVMDSSGNGDDVGLAVAIRYAADHGADVVNMSLGGPVDCPPIVQEAADYAYAMGVVLVAASGNHGVGIGPNAEMFPANCEHVLGVAATESDDSVADYSNYGSHVSVAAPGSGIYSTLMNGGYGYDGGTSMATPYVAGLAALLRARYPAYTPDEIASAILDNADDLGASGWDSHYGCGRIDAYRALLRGKADSSPLCLQGAGAWTTVMTAAVPFVPGAIIVSLRPGIGAETVLQQYDAGPSTGSGHGAEFLPELGVWRLRVAPGQERAILSRLRTDPAVLHADLSYLVSAQ